MGTRADFYIRKEKSLMEYKGSIGYDGYSVREEKDIDDFSPNQKKNKVPSWCEYLMYHSRSEKEFTSALDIYLEKVHHASNVKEHGFPFPWNNSKLTDECYVYDVESNRLYFMHDYEGKYEDHTTPCYFYPVDDYWYDDEHEFQSNTDAKVWYVPDMTPLKNIATGDRSGLLVLTFNSR